MSKSIKKEPLSKLSEEEKKKLFSKEQLEAKKKVGKIKGIEKFRKVRKRRKLILKTKINRVQAFAALSREKYGKYVKAVVIMGSVARGDFKATSDIDTLVIIDDTVSGEDFDSDLREKLHRQLSGLGKGVSKDISVQLHTVTELWDFIKQGDPIFFNYLRNGLPVYDAGFYKPLQRLLKAGVMTPSKEAIFKGLDGAESYIKKVYQYMEWSLERLYRTITWATNAMFMAAGLPPAEPPEMAYVLEHYFVKKNIFKPKIVEDFEELRVLFKKMEHKEKKKIEPEELEKHLKFAKTYVEIMKREVDGYLSGKRDAVELRDKIKSTPKVFWIYKDKSRGYAWLFEDCIFSALYTDKGLEKVLKAEIKEGKLQSFKKSDSDPLFDRLEASTFKPIITVSLVETILSRLPEKLRKKVEKIGVEYPDQALIDLSSVILKTEKKASSSKGKSKSRKKKLRKKKEKKKK